MFQNLDALLVLWVLLDVGVCEERLRRPRQNLNQASMIPKQQTRSTNLLVVGESAHDSRVDDAAQHHGQRVDGQRAVTPLLLHQVAELLIGHLHGFDGILQRADFLLTITGAWI